MKNKILTKIGALVVGLTMAVGVGIAVSNNARLEAKAADATIAGNSGTTATYTVNGSSGVKAGSKNNTGTIKISVPSGASELSFYAGAWKGKTCTITLSSDGVTFGTSSFALEADDSFTGTGTTVTTTSDESTFLCTTTLSGVTSNKDIVLTKTGGNYNVFIVWKATYSDGDPVDPEPVEDVLLDQTELSLEVGKTAKLTATVLPANAHDKSVTWSSDNEDVATVDNGTVTAVAKGEATITVTTVYGGCTATCDVTVTEPAPKLTFNLVKDASDLAAGDKVIIAAKAYNVAMSTTQNNNNRGQVAITKNDESIVEVDNLQIFTLEEGKKEDTFAFNVGGGYIYASSSSSNQLKTETTLSDNSSFSVAIAADGTATLVAQGSNSRKVLQYNEGSTLFACYATASQKAVAIYKAAASDATVLEAAGYAKAFLGAMTCQTVDGQSSVTAAEGAWADMKTAYEALSADAQKYLKKHDAADKDAAVPTGDVTKDNAEAYIGAALIRYEWIIHVYTEATYENFMGRTINATSSTNVEPVKFDHATKNNITLVIIILSVAAITALGAYLFIDKRRKTSK